MKRFFLFLCGLVLISCNNTPGNTPVAENKELVPPTDEIKWDTLNTTFFSVAHPESWSIEFDTLDFYGVVFISPRADAKDEFSENLVCRSRINENHYDVTTLVENALSDLASEISKFDLKEKNINASSGELIYTGEMEGFPMEWHQRFLVMDSTYTMLTFTMEQKNAKGYLPYIKRMFNSFQSLSHEMDH